MNEPVLRDIASLEPFVNNSRVHPHSQVEALTARIDEFGFAGEIIVRGQTIAKGHGCLDAIKLLVSQKKKVYPIPGKKGGARAFPKNQVPVMDASGWTDDQLEAYVHADNRLFELGQTDMEKLRLGLSRLKLNNFDLSIAGFDPKSLDRILAESNEDATARANEIPPVPRVAVTQPGDVWVLGGHRAMCGDSTSVDDLKKLMAGDKADLLHADPPYGMGKQSDGVENDNLYREKLDAFQMAWWRACRQFIADNASVYIWGNAPDLWRLWWRGPLEDGQYIPLGLTERIEFRNEIVWDKKAVPGMKSDLLTQYPEATERCLFFQLGRQFLGNVNTEDYPEEFEPIRTYLEEQAEAVGLTSKILRDLTGVQMYSHWFSKSQFHLIGEKHYNLLATTYPGHFTKPWHELKKLWDLTKGQKSKTLAGKLSATRSYFDNGHSVMRDVWDFERVTGDERYGHATPKPVAMMERVMKSSLAVDSICLEPFGGSGSTLMGCQRTARRCRVMELTPAYVDVIVERWQKFSGEKAVHAVTGKTFDSIAAGVRPHREQE